MGSVLTFAQDQPRAAQPSDTNSARTEQTTDRNDHHDWGWLGLLGLIGLAGLSRRDRSNRTYGDTRTDTGRETNIRRAA
jgi:MYXO-CTERM domain-containing protein